MSKPELYISIDIETDGPCPGVNSMLALGAAAFRPDGQMNGFDSVFYTTLEPLPGGKQHPDTMKWWATQPDAWAEVTTDTVSPDHAMFSFCAWAEKWSEHKLVAVAWPAAFDFAFVNHYCHRFGGSNPLGFACLDLRSYAAGLLNHASYYGLPEAAMKAIAGPKREGLKAHNALDDAIEQGDLLVALLREASKRKGQ